MPKETVVKRPCKPPIRLLYINLLLLLLLVIFTILGVYFFHFKKPPIDQILASNQALSKKQHDMDKHKHIGVMDKQTQSELAWDEWVHERNLIVVGKMFDSCNETERLHIGRVVMKEDPNTKALITETTFNITFEKVFHKGIMHMNTDYNARRLMTRQWDLCRNEENKNSDEILLDCPVKEGTHSFIKQKKIPAYLPKGRFTVNMWAFDENEEIIVCGLTEFTL